MTPGSTETATMSPMPAARPRKNGYAELLCTPVRLVALTSTAVSVPAPRAVEASGRARNGHCKLRQQHTEIEWFVQRRRRAVRLTSLN